MTFHPGIAARDAAAGVGTVDYRLQRRRLLADIESGLTDRSEACDIHPELLRVARNAAMPFGRDCPLCQDGALKLVAYVFGPRLGGGGKCVVSDDELQRLAKRSGEFIAYEVEVCPDCGWNHLVRRYPLDNT
ncbi:MAG: DUF5318 family protein [Actinomycetota bacterium]|nr:DUF5318 family protein [Actinomycetota bacterium]